MIVFSTLYLLIISYLLIQVKKYANIFDNDNNQMTIKNFSEKLKL